MAKPVDLFVCFGELGLAYGLLILSLDVEFGLQELPPAPASIDTTIV